MEPSQGVRTNQQVNVTRYQHKRSRRYSPKCTLFKKCNSNNVKATPSCRSHPKESREEYLDTHTRRSCHRPHRRQGIRGRWLTEGQSRIRGVTDCNTVSLISAELLFVFVVSLDIPRNNWGATDSLQLRKDPHKYVLLNGKV